ncbi:MAG: protein kinase [Chloroflexi bacterium]|nr:protein kinase [Chloroflexota bacterium]
MDQTAQSWIGKQIGQYTIQSLIKKGGMAYVYYAIDQALERPVALKILFKNLTQDQTFIERFRREARAVAKLRHPNIVQIYTTGETPDGEYYIAMEYISGGSLREQLDRLAQQGHVLQTTESLKIVEQVASALVASHQANIIHRDLKPSNILLRTNGTPVITDLGIAKMQNEATLTRLDELVGTPYYMSPEQVNSQPVDGRSDIYSLGMILYEMLSGRRAFTGDTPWAILSKHITETPQPISQLRPDISAQTATMVHTCLQKEPASRYQTAADLIMLAAKQAIQSEQTGQAASLGAATYAAATVVAAAAPETMVGATRVGESPTVVRAPRQKRPFSPFWLIPVFLALLLGCAAAAIFFTPLNEMLFGGETAVPLAIITTIDSATATQPSTTEPTANNPTVANTEIAVIETTPAETDAIPAEDTPVPTKPPKQTSTPKPTSTGRAPPPPYTYQNARQPQRWQQSGRRIAPHLRAIRRLDTRR